MTAAHSILPPSSAAAWKRCGLWVAMNQAYPKPDTPESMEGTAAHWAAWELLAGRVICEGLVCPNGIVVTQEMIDGAELLVETIHARMPPDVFGPWQIEQAVAIPEIHAQCWGTPDAWAFRVANMTLEVIDYKFGHRFVDEWENDQGVTYTAGILDVLAAYFPNIGPGDLDQLITVNFTVVQPRCFYKGSPVRTWTVKASDLRAHINILRMAAEVALGPNPPAVTNDECIDCPGRAACPSLQKSAYFGAEIATRSGPVELTPAAASLELRMLERAADRLNARVEGLRETVTAYARQGVVTPFHKLEQGFGRQQWTVPPDQVLAMGDLLGVDLSKPGVKTPKQAKASGVDEAVIKAYSVTPMGALKLTPENPTDARRVFGFK